MNGERARGREWVLNCLKKVRCEKGGESNFNARFENKGERTWGYSAGIMTSIEGEGGKELIMRDED